MCYSAQVEHNLKLIAKLAAAKLDAEMFVDVFARRAEGEDIKLAKALEANFLKPTTTVEKRIAKSIASYHTEQIKQWETELFKQKKRNADAQRSMKLKTTKKAENDLRVSTNKIAWLKSKIANIKRKSSKPDDGRIFPFWYAPVVVEENGQRWIRPMRYHLRMHGKPANTDQRFPGLYNARRDNLERYWKSVFGQHHAVVLLTGFYENVAKHDFERRQLRKGEKPENLVLHFNPNPAHIMLVACLWDRWEKKGETDLYSFAAITDEPPAEVAATGHNRCIIPLQQHNLGAWLVPNGDVNLSYSLLDDRDRPYYEHQHVA